MSTLLVKVLEAELSNEWMFYLNKTYQIAGFYPYLYMQDAPAGTVTFQFLKDGQVLFEETITSDDIKLALNTSDDHAHLWYPFVPQKPILLKRGIYTAKLISGGGYTESSTTFFGWVKEHIDAYNETDYAPASDIERPYALKLKQLRQGIFR